MDTNELSTFYTNLKKSLADPNPIAVPAPTDNMVMHKMIDNRDKLKDDCCKHLVLNLYCKVLPLDQDWIRGNMGQMQNDVNSMLAKRNMNGIQYMTACKESTKAPMFEFVLRSVDLIGSTYMEEAKSEAEEEKKITGKNTMPKDADVNSVKDMTKDIEEDTEVKAATEAIKEKTKNQIVEDVSKTIINSKNDDSMEFRTKNESAFNTAMEYFQGRLARANVEITESADMEEMIGMCIREATWYEINRAFNQIPVDFKKYADSINMGSGIVVNTESVNAFITEKKKVKKDEEVEEEK